MTLLKFAEAAGKKNRKRAKSIKRLAQNRKASVNADSALLKKIILCPLHQHKLFQTRPSDQIVYLCIICHVLLM